MIDAFHRGLISQDVQEKLLADIDVQLLHLESVDLNEIVEQKPPLDRAGGHSSEK
ncbi:MAG: hypothetical protein PHW13_05430 [Methylococcales bacterium]|nr:hypothetical protein [Methylococcales bacterium]